MDDSKINLGMTLNLIYSAVGHRMGDMTFIPITFISVIWVQVVWGKKKKKKKSSEDVCFHPQYLNVESDLSNMA